MDGDLINIGFMVFEPQFFDMIDGDDTILEREPMERLLEQNQLMAYTHHGFWQCMDTMREKEKLEKMVAEDRAPWIYWK